MTVAILDTDEMLTPEQAAEVINFRLRSERRISPHSVRKYCLNYEQNETEGRTGEDRLTPEIPAIRIGRSWQIKRGDAVTYRTDRAEPGRPRKQKV